MRPDLRGAGAPPRTQFEPAYRGALLLLVPATMLAFLVWQSPEARAAAEAMNVLGPTWLFCVLTGLAVMVLRCCPTAIWTPLFWVPVHCAVFYGFGPLVAVFGNEITLASLSAHPLAVSDRTLLRVNALSLAGSVAVTAGIWLHLRLQRLQWQRLVAGAVRTTPSRVPLPALALIFVALGAALKYGLLLPALWQGGEVVVAGILSRLSTMIDIGFAIAAYLAVSGHRGMKIFLVLGLAPHVLLSVLTFAKAQVVLSLMLPALGAYLAHGRLWRLAAAGAVVAVVFAAIGPLAKHGRFTILERSGSIHFASVAQRADIAASYLRSGGQSDFVRAGRQTWWTRLSFSRQQGFAMQLRDQRVPTTSLHRAWLYFIPRAIWPEKPIMVAPGLDFFRRATGQDGYSFMPATVFGDLFWQFGWAGVWLGSLAIGGLFAALSHPALAIMQARDLVMLPVVLVTVQMGALSLSKFVINGIIAPLPILAAYYLLFRYGLPRMQRGTTVGLA